MQRKCDCSKSMTFAISGTVTIGNQQSFSDKKLFALKTILEYFFRYDFLLSIFHNTNICIFDIHFRIRNAEQHFNNQSSRSVVRYSNGFVSIGIHSDTRSIFFCLCSVLCVDAFGMLFTLSTIFSAHRFIFVRFSLFVVIHSTICRLSFFFPVFSPFEYKEKQKQRESERKWLVPFLFFIHTSFLNSNSIIILCTGDFFFTSPLSSHLAHLTCGISHSQILIRFWMCFVEFKKKDIF